MPTQTALWHAVITTFALFAFTATTLASDPHFCFFCPTIEALVAQGISGSMPTPSTCGRVSVGPRGVSTFRKLAIRDVPISDDDDEPILGNATLVPRASPCGKAPGGVPQHNFNDCCNDLTGTTLHFHGSKHCSKLQISNVPYNCIAISQYLDSINNHNGPSPHACGSDCLEWTGLSVSQYTGIKQAFNV
ncbi:hypothetical protein LTR17_014089 [Elasticomyces elasticus]|nr:hypothetical protein LTR17_014089 [Elasticomyces elasticus]